jgi:hypothetical protein
VLFGSDWPFVPARLVAKQIAIHAAPSNHSEIERTAIDRGNALKLWPAPLARAGFPQMVLMPRGRRCAGPRCMLL